MEIFVGEGGLIWIETVLLEVIHPYLNDHLLFSIVLYLIHNYSSFLFLAVV